MNIINNINLPQVMLDLETLSSEPTAAIVSIGAVKFTLSGEIIDKFYCVIEAQTAEDAGLHISASTFMWWMQQNQEARDALGKNAISLKQALVNFHKWYGDDRDLPMWGNGVDFDNVILRNAYKACTLPVPWGFRSNRCYRTVKALYGHDGLKPEMAGTAHNALDDALYQAAYLQNMFKGRLV